MNCQTCNKEYDSRYILYEVLEIHSTERVTDRELQELGWYLFVNGTQVEILNCPTCIKFNET